MSDQNPLPGDVRHNQIPVGSVTYSTDLTSPNNAWKIEKLTTKQKKITFIVKKVHYYNIPRPTSTLTAVSL